MSAPDPLLGFLADDLPALGRFHRMPEVQGTGRAVSEAALQRGLSVETGRAGLLVLRKGTTVVGSVHKMVTSLVPQPVVPMAQNKEFAGVLLRSAGLPVPTAQAFAPDRAEEGILFALSLGRAVVKPRSGRAGQGVTVDLVDEAQVRSAWVRAADADPHGVVVVEEHVVGLDLRIVVVGDRPVGAAVCLPALVIGDGTGTVAQLVAQHQARRSRHANFRDEAFPPEGAPAPDEERVPRAGEVVLLAGRAIIGGAETAEVLGTGMVHPEHLRLAVRAARAFGTGMAGVDLLVPDLRHPAGAVVNEVNTGPGLRMHRYPAYGPPSDIAGPIVEEMMARSGVRMPRDRSRARGPRAWARQQAGGLRRRIRRCLPRRGRA